jgi:adenylosuccinate lyase
MSQSDPIHAISAIDGRYRGKVEPLADICSEFGLMKFRTEVECRWVEFLGDLPAIQELPALESRGQTIPAHINERLRQNSSSTHKAF